MNRLEKLFSRKTVALMRRCQVFMRCWAEANAEGVKVRLMNDYGAHYDPNTDIIYIDRHARASYAIISFVHEFVHARKCRTKPMLLGRDRRYRKRWIAKQIDNEAEAIIAETDAIKELIRLGQKLKADELIWLKRFRRGGKPAIVKALQTTMATDSFELYPEHYGNWYDRYDTDHAKHCGKKRKTCKRGVNHTVNIERRAKYEQRRTRELAESNPSLDDLRIKKSR